MAKAADGARRGEVAGMSGTGEVAEGAALAGRATLTDTTCLL
jgi:hypothetical protein